MTSCADRPNSSGNRAKAARLINWSAKLAMTEVVKMMIEVEQALATRLANGKP